jgi:hypothetical protein
MMYIDEVRKMCEAFKVEFDSEEPNVNSVYSNPPLLGRVANGNGNIDSDIVAETRCQDEVHPRQNLSLVHKFSYLRQMNLMKKPVSFLALLSRDADCTDDRDKICALWNLAKDAGQLALALDYELSVHQVYISFAKAYIEHHESRYHLHLTNAL